MRREAIVGSLLGTAVGDALGLPYEGLSRQRAVKLFGAPTRHRFVFGASMVSDDTEHTAMVAQALIIAGGDVAAFQKDFKLAFANLAIDPALRGRLRNLKSDIETHAWLTFG